MIQCSVWVIEYSSDESEFTNSRPWSVMSTLGQPILHMTYVVTIIITIKLMSQADINFGYYSTIISEFPYRVNELRNTQSSLVRQWCSLSPLSEVISEGDNVLVTPWCHWHWPNKVHAHLIPYFGLDWDGMKNSRSFLQLKVVPLALFTCVDLHGKR